ncbi:MAG TPA: hypothetical protein VFT10_04580 [Solirubrobacterales bacterium]|nr:hypothetical protein [Solirubrobacterales bacterium]
MSAIANRIMRAFSLVITDRRWTAPLSAAALGFGLFVGVAIGPNAAGTLAGATQILEIPSGGGSGDEPDLEAGGLGLAGSGGGGSGGGGASLEAPLAPAPLAPAPVALSPEEEAAPKQTPPASKEPNEEDEEETELTGVVVHANPAAGSYALAIKGGELVPVHARKLPPPGAKLTVIARRLANGTFAESEPPKRSGKASQASFRGVVTYLDPNPAAPAYTVSGRGASLLVHVEPDPGGAAPQLPARGSYVTVTAEMKEPLAPPAAQPDAAEPAPAVVPTPEPICAPDPSLPASPQIEAPAVLWQRQIEIEAGEPSAYLDLAGIVKAVCPETGHLLLSADGLAESSGDLTLTVPAKIDASKLKPGDSILATATVEPDSTLSLAGLAGDEQIKGANNPTLAQGDLKR